MPDLPLIPPRPFPGLWQALREHEDIILRIGALLLDPLELYSLYTADPVFYRTVRRNIGTWVRVSIRRWGDVVSRDAKGFKSLPPRYPINALTIFPPRFNRKFWMVDPQGRIARDTSGMELAPERGPRVLLTFRYMFDVMYKIHTVHSILRSFAWDYDIHLPGPMLLTLGKLWFLMEQRSNGPRIAFIQDRKWFTDRDVALALQLMIKIDLVSNYPTSGHVFFGLRKLILAQKTLSFLLRVIDRYRLRTVAEMQALAAEMLYAPQANPRAQGKLHYTAYNALRWEYPGLGWQRGQNEWTRIDERTGQLERRPYVQLIEMDELLIKESCRRRCFFHKRIDQFLTSGFVNAVTGRLAPRIIVPAWHIVTQICLTFPDDVRDAYFWNRNTIVKKLENLGVLKEEREANRGERPRSLQERLVETRERNMYYRGCPECDTVNEMNLGAGLPGRSKQEVYVDFGDRHVHIRKAPTLPRVWEEPDSPLSMALDWPSGRGHPLAPAWDHAVDTFTHAPISAQDMANLEALGSIMDFSLDDGWNLDTSDAGSDASDQEVQDTEDQELRNMAVLAALGRRNTLHSDGLNLETSDPLLHSANQDMADLAALGSMDFSLGDTWDLGTTDPQSHMSNQDMAGLAALGNKDPSLGQDGYIGTSDPWLHTSNQDMADLAALGDMDSSLWDGHLGTSDPWSHTSKQQGTTDLEALANTDFSLDDGGLLGIDGGQWSHTSNQDMADLAALGSMNVSLGQDGTLEANLGWQSHMSNEDMMDFDWTQLGDF